MLRRRSAKRRLQSKHLTISVYGTRRSTLPSFHSRCPGRHGTVAVLFPSTIEIVNSGSMNSCLLQHTNSFNCIRVSAIPCVSIYPCAEALVAKEYSSHVWSGWPRLSVMPQRYLSRSLNLHKHTIRYAFFSLLSVVSRTKRSAIYERCFDILKCAFASIRTMIGFAASIWWWKYCLFVFMW